MSCRCGEVTIEAFQCAEHFHLWKGGKRLASVSSIVRERFPMPDIPEDILEHARVRGKAVDDMFALWLNDSLDEIPVGTSHEVRDLFIKVKDWFQAQRFRSWRTQVLLADTDHGGLVDFIFDDEPWDLKCTSGKLEQYAHVQVAGYSTLYGRRGSILQVNKGLVKAKARPLTDADMDEWAVTMQEWRAQRRQE